MIVSFLRSTKTTVSSLRRRSALLPPPLLSPSRSFAKPKTPKTTLNRGKVKIKGPRKAGGEDLPDSSTPEDPTTSFELPTHPLPFTYDPALDVGPGGRPLFSITQTLSPLTRKQSNTYVDFSLEEWNAVLPEGIPVGMKKEFEETRRCAVMVRQSFLDLRDNFRRVANPTLRPGNKSKLG